MSEIITLTLRSRNSFVGSDLDLYFRNGQPISVRISFGLAKSDINSPSLEFFFLPRNALIINDSHFIKKHFTQTGLIPADRKSGEGFI